MVTAGSAVLCVPVFSSNSPGGYVLDPKFTSRPRHVACQVGVHMLLPLCRQRLDA